MGPVEYVVIGFPGNRFNGDVIPALRDLVAAGTVNILDLVFIHKDADGVVTALELGDDPDSAHFDDLDGEVGFLLSESDIEEIAADMPANTSAGLLVWENAWAERFANAVRGSGGEVLASSRIPLEVVEAAIAYTQGQSA